MSKVDNYNNGAVDNHSDDDEDSSISDEKMKIVDKKSAKPAAKVDDDSDSDVENDHSATNNGFGVDGEPDYKPRKVK
jgi:hypothetical protein